MATAHSNRHPSPLSSRPNNPNPKNSDNNNQPIRRSFSGANNPFSKPSVVTNSRRFDPITPANSPSDFARRRSVGRDSVSSSLKDSEEKENDEKNQNLKASKHQSPAKGSKNFMSPTISAASKFTPSPRKKVLVERNDPLRTSMSLCDGKAMFFSTTTASEDLDSKSEMGSHQNVNFESPLELNDAYSEKKEAVTACPPVSKPLKKVKFLEIPSDSQHASESLSESVITDSSSKKNLSCSSTSPSIAPLDADSSLPPYNPKTNYLSPRPQFLHYRPKPRIDIFLDKESDLDPDGFKQLEDSFLDEISSDNFSGSEDSEESQTEEHSQNDEQADMVLGAEDDDICVSGPSESLPVSTPVSNTASESEEQLVPKKERKRWSFLRWMCFSVFVMFLIACASISVTHSPAFDGLVLEDFSLSNLSNFYHQSSFAASAKENMDRLLRRVKQFSVESASFISKMINELDEGEKLSPLQFMNLTDLQGTTWNGVHYNEAIVENLEEDGMEEEDITEMDTLEDESFEEVDSDESFEDGFDEQDDVSEAEEAWLPTPEKPSENSEIIQKETSSELAAVSQDQESVEAAAEFPGKLSENSEITQAGIVSESATTSQDQENMFEAAIDVAETEKLNHDETNLLSSSATSLDTKSPLNVNSLSEEEPVTVQSESRFLDRHIMTLSSLFAALMAVAFFVLKSKGNINSTNAVVQIDDAYLNNKKIGLGITGTKNLHEEKLFSQNWETEVDVTGEACPSEMSSFRKSASYNQGAASEVQSFERKTRNYSKRESLASSSSEFSLSPSYGSFTTYERIPIKKANNGEEEIVTPVRRSSRIRKHHPVISP